jgi:hypothetical protein
MTAFSLVKGKTMTVMKPVYILLFLLTSLCASGQKTSPDEDVHARLLAGKKKSLIAYAGEYHSFTLEVPPQGAKPSDVPGFITIDKQIIQSTLVPADKSVDAGHSGPDREHALLLKYMNYELGYYKKKLKQDYSHLQTEWVTLQGRLFLVWYFDMPKNYKLVSRQVYLSTLFFDQVMDLNAPVFAAADFAKAKGILVRLAGSMKTYDKKLDLEALQRKLAK